MSIPSKAQWGIINKNNLDANCAFEQFAGKSTSDVEKMFIKNAFYYQEDLLSTPAIAFNYYAPVFAKYILSDTAKGDSDGASSFLYMIIELLESNRFLASVTTQKTLIYSAKIVSEKQSFYDADVDIYGSFSTQYNQIYKLEKDLKKYKCSNTV